MRFIPRKSLLPLSVFLPLCFIPAFCQAQTKPVADDARQAERVDAYVHHRMKALHIPGLSLAVLRGVKVILARGYGTANLELSAPATEETAYSIASITKTFTALATMMLVEDGKVSLEDPISKHLSGLPTAWHQVTVRQLLNHTSGISSFANHKRIPCPVGKAERDYEQADVLKEVACLPLDFAPGERWAYGDTGYYLLGMLIEKVSGKTYEQFLRERMFEPLGMDATHVLDYSKIVPHRADGYSRAGGEFRNARRFTINEFSNAGLVSTVLDMARLDAALGAGKVLKQATLEQMWTNARLNNGRVVESYGLGFGMTPFRGHRRVGHTGGGGMGFATAYQRFLDDNVTVILLSNADQEGFAVGEMANEIASFYFRQ